MSEPRPHPPALLVVAAFSRHPDAIAWSRERLESLYGPVAMASAPYAFVQTAYYAESMGADLQKQLLVLRDLVPAESLPDVKLRSNALEEELAEMRRFPEARPLNLDPGILTLGKFQLATTKDQAHRVYLCDGIYAEVTLRYEAGAWVPWPWTYADYRLPEVAEFLKRARGFYKDRLREYTERD